MMRAAGGLGPPAVLLAVTAALYAGVITHPFEYDDFHSLVENGTVHGFGRFAALWTSPTAVSAEGSPGYRPVLLSVWALQWAEGQALNERIVEARIGRAGMALLRGDMLARRGNWDGARRAYLEAEELGGRGPELDARLGAVAERMGNRAEVLTFYRRAATEMATTKDEAAWGERARAALARMAETGS